MVLETTLRILGLPLYTGSRSNHRGTDSGRDGEEEAGDFSDLPFSWAGASLRKLVLASAHAHQERCSDCALVSLCASGQTSPKMGLRVGILPDFWVRGPEDQWGVEMRRGRVRGVSSFHGVSVRASRLSPAPLWSAYVPGKRPQLCELPGRGGAWASGLRLESGVQGVGKEAGAALRGP